MAALVGGNALYVFLARSGGTAAGLVLESEVVLVIGALGLALGGCIWVLVSSRAIIVSMEGVSLESRLSTRTIPWSWILGDVTKAPFGGFGIWYHDPESSPASSRRAFVATVSQATAIVGHPNWPSGGAPSLLDRSSTRP